MAHPAFSNSDVRQRPLGRLVLVVLLLTGFVVHSGHLLTHVHGDRAGALSPCGHDHGGDPAQGSLSTDAPCTGCLLAVQCKTAVVFELPSASGGVMPRPECQPVREQRRPWVVRSTGSIRGPPSSL